MQPGVKPGDQPHYHELDEYTFQRLCRDLFGREPAVRNCYEYGVRGQSQKGVDLVAHRVNGGIEVGQCKKYAEYSARDIETASDKFLEHRNDWQEKGVERFILFVACSLNRTQEQDEIIRQTERFRGFSIAYEVWADNIITDKLRPHKDLVAHYFDAADYWIKRICGESTAMVSVPVRAAVVTSDIHSTQLEQLAGRLTTQVELHLEANRQAWREGKRSGIQRWVKETRADQTLWAAFSPNLKARFLRFEASMQLAPRGSLDRAKALCAEADGYEYSHDGVRLRALIAHAERDPSRALELLESVTDIDSVNLRIALLLELDRLDDCAELLTHIKEHLTPNAETYRLRAIYHLSRKNPTQARADVQEALAREPRWMSIREAAAIVNYCNALSPGALPGRVSAYPEPVPWTLVRRDGDSVLCLRYAAETFEGLAGEPDLSEDDRRRFAAWSLACLANDVHRQDQATEYCRRALSADPSNPYVIAWVNARNWPVDLSRSEETLSGLVRGDSASVPEVLALAGSLLSRGEAGQVLELLSTTRSLFRGAHLESLWHFWRCQGLVVANDIEGAQQCAESLAGTELGMPARLEVLRALARRDSDGTGLADYLKQQYEETGNPLVLLESCEVMAQRSEWRYISEHSSELVEGIGTAESVTLAAVGCFNHMQFETCLSILDKYQEYFTDSKLPGHLKRLKVACQQELGIIPQAVAEAQLLVSEEATVRNLLTLAQAYYAHGDLKSVALVARQIESRSEASAEQYLRLARLVQWDDRKLAVALWRRGTSCDLPDERVGEAVSLGFQLGVDRETGPLMKRMAQLGENPRAGIQQKSVQELIGFMEQRRESTMKLSDLYAVGRIPIHLAIRPLNLSLATVYHTALDKFERDRCPLHATSLLARHGGRAPLPETLPDSRIWRLNMDVTAILMAAHLGILERVLATDIPVRIPPNLVPALLAIRERITPHQPSRFNARRQILDLIQEGKIKVLSRVQLEPQAPSNQDFEGHWLGLYEFARTRRGYLVDFLPLLRRDLSGPVQSLPDDGPNHLVNCTALVLSLRQHGPLAELEYARALEELGSEGEKPAALTVPEHGKPIVLQSGIPELLADAGILKAVCERFEVHIDQSEAERITGETQLHLTQQEPVEWLGAILETIRSGIAEGKIEVLRISPATRRTRSEQDHLSCPELEGLLDLLSFDPDAQDVIWADDRHVNGHLVRDGVPIIGVNEVLMSLVELGHLSTPEYYRILSRMRAASILFIPLNSDELLFHLDQVRVVDSRVVETSDLTVLRRYISKSLLGGANLQRAIDESQPGEIPFLVTSVQEMADSLAGVWREVGSGAPPEDCRARADWVFENLYIDLGGMVSVLPWTSSRDTLFSASLSVAALLFAGFKLRTDAPGRASEARRQYFSWLDERVLRPQFRANPHLVSAVVEHLKGFLAESAGRSFPEGEADSEYIIARRIVTQQFYDDLVEPLRDELNRDVEFMSTIGIRVLSVVTIGQTEFVHADFIAAVSEVVNGRVGTAMPLEPAGSMVTFEPHPQRRDGCVAILEPGEQQVAVADEIFHVLLDSPSDREAVLRRNRHWFDCSPEQFNKLVPEIVTIREPDRRLVEAEWWRESSVQAYYHRLGQAIGQRGGLSRKDLELPAVEKLCWYLGLSPKVDAGSEFQQGLLQAADSLLAEHAPAVVFARLSGLPVPLPSPVITRILELKDEDRRRLVKNLLAAASSPIAKMHLVRILVLLNEDSYLRLARRIIRHLQGPAGDVQVQAYGAILKWVELHFEQSTLTSSARLAAVWAHANLLFSAFIGRGVTTEWVKETFEHWGRHLSLGKFRRDSDYWYDVSSPRMVSREGLLLSGLSYALGPEAGDLVDEATRRQLANKACVLIQGVLIPAETMLRDLTECPNALGSFLGGERGQTYAALIGQDNADVLSSRSVHTFYNVAIGELEASNAHGHLWSLIQNMYHGGRPDEDLTGRVTQVILNTDFLTLRSQDPDAMIVALLTSSLHAGIAADDTLHRHVVEQIIAAAEAPTESGTSSASDGRARPDFDVDIALLQCALNVSIVHGNLEGTVKGFSDVVWGIMQVRASARGTYRPLLQLLLRILPLTASQPLWKPLLMARGA